jgi:hypothetical protein
LLNLATGMDTERLRQAALLLERQSARLFQRLERTLLPLLGLMAGAGMLSACFFLPHGAYYKPSYPDDKVAFERAVCGGQVGPLSVIKIPVRDGFIELRLDEDVQGSLELSLSLETSRLSKLQFTSDVIRLTDPEKGTEWTPNAGTFRLAYFQSGQIPYSEPVDFSGNLPAAPEDILNDMEVWIPFSVEDFSPDAVRVRLPLIVAGTEELQVPPLIWKADKEGKTVEGYDKSWDWWPYTEGEARADRVTVRAGVTGGYHGSSEVDRRRKAPHLQGNIMIEFPADMTWRFASDEVVFEDVGSGETRRMHFRHLQDQSFVTVPFATRFCCTTAAWSTTSLPTGEERPEQIRVELPPLLINGEEFVIQPITFDLHRFDFGIYPFNC